MYNQDLLAYIRQSLADGLNPEQIRKNLVDGGWPTDAADTHLAMVTGKTSGIGPQTRLTDGIPTPPAA